MALQAGDKAVDFTGVQDDGRTVSLDSFRGQKLLLYFYPKDNTPGCTAEACSLRDGYQALQAQGVAVVGVSPDSIASHQGFKAKYSLPFPLISDADHTISMAYGAWGEKNLYGKKTIGMIRKSFLIDEQGVIMHVFGRVKTKEHAAQVLEKLGEGKSPEGRKEAGKGA